MQLEKFEYGITYHICNRGINREDIFKEEKNYAYFLSLMKKYLVPVADIYAYCLMKNHYHILLHFKEQQNVLVSDAYQPLSNMLNAYSKSINKSYQRTGSLFQRHPKRNRVNDKEYFMQLVVYIHLNPVKHKFSMSLDYPHSSYQSIISNKPTNLDRKTVIDYFDDVDNLIAWHDFKYLQHQKVKELIEEDN
jgi:REP element-mobilizing transposase RayT